MPSQEKPGAKTTLSDADRARFIEALQDGAHLTTACKLVRLSANTYKRWRGYAAKGGEDNQWYVDFIGDSDVAEAEGELFHIRTLKKGAEGKAASDQWRASAEFLKRRHGERWNRGWSPVEADKPDDLGDMTSILNDPQKTEQAASLVEQLVNGNQPQQAGTGAVVPGWIRGSGERGEVDPSTSPGAPKPRAPRGRRRKNAAADSGDASTSRQVGADK